jgi:hypothetical protein
MTRKDHKQWRQRRKQAGWVYGPKRDEAKKINPDLVDWRDLPEEEKEKNRRFVRGLLSSLARAGFQIERYS